MCWSIVVKEKPTVCSPFFRAFPSDRILNATQDVNVHVLFTAVQFPSCNNSCYFLPANSGNVLNNITLHSTHFCGTANIVDYQKIYCLSRPYICGGNCTAFTVCFWFTIPCGNIWPAHSHIFHFAIVSYLVLAASDAWLPLNQHPEFR